MSRLLRLWAALWLWVAAGPALAQSVGAFVSPGPLAEDHAEYEGITQCTLCHAPGRGVTPDRCLACHERVAEQVQTKKGFHADKGDRCATCHSDHKGRDHPLARVSTQHFDHLKETGFALTGAHQWLECTGCHEEGEWQGLDPACKSCHEDPHGAEADRARVDRCEGCHRASGWSVAAVDPAVLDHRDPKQVDYVLEGAHLQVACLDCHPDGRFAPVDALACTDCHEPVHRTLPKTCDDCHTVRGFSFTTGFDHARTGWPLEGLHARVGCDDCHRGDVTRRVPHEGCASCHEDVHRGQFAPRGCESCHTVSVAGFRIPDFDHAATTFPLRGEHQRVGCAGCHGEGPGATWQPVAHQDCDDCHEDFHAGKFEPQACRTCHSERGWGVEDFDHDQTAFPLKGEHASVACERCHTEGVYAGLPHDSCADCHRDHPHEAQFDGEPGRCAECHVETGFLAVTFAHADRTGFDLAPQHDGTVACTDCHTPRGAFAGLAADCASCHDPDRPPGHYPGACDTCHRAAGWAPADLGDLDHAVTGFPLRGSHARLPCADCHGPDVRPRGAASLGCVDCHADDDPHRNLLGSACEDCHVETTWVSTRFRHHQTGWPLRGAHRLAACVDCHATGYAGTPDRCAACHQREAPLDVAAHRSAFFPQCETCHRPYTWAAVVTR